MTLVLSKGSETIETQDFTTAEEKELMRSWNPPNLQTHLVCMHHLIEAKAQEVPDVEAICAWDGRLSYSELDQCATATAQRLIEVGVRPGSYVPFMYEKSMWAVVALYAVLKAGGAFVPLDPTHPERRIRKITDGVGAKVAVASRACALLLDRLVDNVVVISESDTKKNTRPASEPVFQIDVKSSDPMLVLFTSGSTGEPKGMILQHGAICTHALTHGAEMGYHGARVYQFAAHTFDVAVMDFFTTLLYGGCICVPSEEERQTDIIGSINRLRANLAILTPSFAGLIEPSEVPTLKTVAIGGEKLSLDRVQRWAGKVSLIQIYGPAEVGICLLRHMGRQDSMPENVGYVMKNCSCWLVDPENHNELVPFGAVGELLVLSPSLARGYLNDEAKTRACFIDDPSWARTVGLTGARFYKTGDLLRYNSVLCDGSYDFVGRKDTQIKVRGQRTELGELEHHIANMPGIAVSMVSRPGKGCFAGELVVVIQMRDGTIPRVRDERLELVDGQALSIDTFRTHLAPILPRYMLPTICLEVKSMPFVPSLKVNRKMVEGWLVNMDKPPSSVASLARGGFNADALRPDEVTARMVSAEIARMLGGGDGMLRNELFQNDFAIQEAGLDSLQIMSLSMHVQKRFQAKLPLVALLSSKLTVRRIASIIDGKHSTFILTDLIPVDLEAEVTTLYNKLIRGLSAPTSRNRRSPRGAQEHVFLTGASGYLGSAILEQLLDRPNTSVFALMRCSDEREGLERLIDASKKAGWWREAHASRLSVWRGDLTAPRLGLQQNHLDELCGDGSTAIHSIIHNAARVHYNLDYSSLKAANVDSTIELLRLTAESRCISGFVLVGGGRTPDDEGQPAHLTASKLTHGTGYAQTKFVSESLVRSAAASNLGAFQGRNLHILRPGYIVGSLGRRQGISRRPPNERDFLWRLVAGCVGLGGYDSDSADRWLHVADVQRVASAAVVMALAPGPNHTAATSQSGLEALPILDGLRFSDLWAILGRCGYVLEPLGHAQWIERLQAAVEAQEAEHPLFPVMHVLAGEPFGAVPVGENPCALVGGEILEAMRRVMLDNVQYLAKRGFLPLKLDLARTSSSR